MHIDVAPTQGHLDEIPRGSFRAPNEYDPMRTIRQIVLLQLLFSLVFALVLWAVWRVEGGGEGEQRRVLASLFNAAELFDLSRRSGWVNAGAIIFSAAIMYAPRGNNMFWIYRRGTLTCHHMVGGSC